MLQLKKSNTLKQYKAALKINDTLAWPWAQDLYRSLQFTLTQTAQCPHTARSSSRSLERAESLKGVHQSRSRSILSS